MRIHGNSLILRAIERKDLTVLHKWANDPLTQDAIGELHFPSSMEFHEQWFSAQVGDTRNQRFIVETPKAEAIGLASIVKIDWRNRNAWHGLVIGEPGHRGKGYAVDAIMATMRYAFDELNLERLDGSMIEYNERSVAAYCGKKIGWKIEGRKNRYFYRKGRYWDQIIVGITRQEYLQHCETTKYWET